MKLFWVILRGFFIIWVLLVAVITGLLLLIFVPRTAIIVGGISSTLITGGVVYLIVQGKVREIERANPELKKRRRR